MTELQIEKGIELNCNEFTIAARKMAIGDSVRFTSENEANALCRALVKEYGPGSFTLRTIEEGKFRVWRDTRTPQTRKPKTPKAEK